MHQSEVHQCPFIVSAASIVLNSSSPSFTAFLVCLHGFQRLRATDWRRWWGVIYFSWRMLLTHSRDNQPPTHTTHTHIHLLNAYCTANSQPTLSHYTWMLAAHDNTLYGLSCLPDTLSISASIYSLVAGWMRDLPPPMPLNYCFLTSCTFSFSPMSGAVLNLPHSTKDLISQNIQLHKSVPQRTLWTKCMSLPPVLVWCTFSYEEE